MNDHDTSRRHFMFVIAIVAILSLGAFSWIAIDASEIDATMMEGAIYVVARKSGGSSSEAIMSTINSIKINEEEFADLDLVLNEL